MRGTLLTFAGAAALCVATTSFGAVIFEDNFDSYASTDAMKDVWAGGPGVLKETAGFNGSKALYHDGTKNDNIATINKNILSNVAPTASENIVLTSKMYDDGSTDTYQTTGIRDESGASPYYIFEMGYCSWTTGSYNIRTKDFPGVSKDWHATTGEKSANAWNEFKATFSLTEIKLEIDFLADGTVDFTYVTELNGEAWEKDFDQIRLGGPSGGPSSKPMLFDDIKLESVAVPEPASLALFGLAGLAMLRRRK